MLGAVKEQPATVRRLNVGFVPTGAVGKRLNAIKSDLNNRALPAHVNLAHRASTTQLDEELVDLIGDVVQDFDPFEVKIGGIETFLPASRVVVALVEPARLLESLHRKLARTADDFRALSASRR